MNLLAKVEDLILDELKADDFIPDQIEGEKIALTFDDDGIGSEVGRVNVTRLAKRLIEEGLVK